MIEPGKEYLLPGLQQFIMRIDGIAAEFPIEGSEPHVNGIDLLLKPAGAELQEIDFNTAFDLQLTAEREICRMLGYRPELIICQLSLSGERRNLNGIMEQKKF